MASTKRTIGAGTPIIMVDDSHTDFHIASLMYKKSNLANPLVHCESGRSLLDYLDQHSDTQPAPAELILMDINMPGMNGIDTVAAVRQRPEYAEIPIIAMLTSSADPKDLERATRVGANHYFNKPMNPTAYIEMFNNLATTPSETLS